MTPLHRLNKKLFSEGLHNGKMNSLARSNASIYGNKEDLYDRLKRHAYPAKKGDDITQFEAHFYKNNQTAV